MTQKQLIEQATKYIGEYFSEGQFIADFMKLTSSERVKFSIDVIKSIKTDGLDQGKVVIELVYPDDKIPDTSQEAA